MSPSRQRFCGLAVLLAACGDSVTAPLPNSSSQLPTINAAVVDIDDCVRGAGYWKTHPSAWPARIDPRIIFYTSGKSWIEVLNTPPQGDPFYILAHQFIAAGLNLDQIDPSIRPDEIGTPFAITGRDYFTDAAHSDLTRPDVISLEILFESFNEGERGVRPCP